VRLAQAAYACAALLVGAIFAGAARGGDPDPASFLAARFAKEVTTTGRSRNTARCACLR